MLAVVNQRSFARISYPVAFIFNYDIQSQHLVSRIQKEEYSVIPNTTNTVTLGTMTLYCIYEVSCDSQSVLRFKNISPADSPVSCTPTGGPTVFNNELNIKVRDKTK